MRPRYPTLFLYLFLTFSSGCVWWKAIPEGEWAMPTTDASGKSIDAVILDREVRLHKRFIEHRARIRVLNEAGRRAVELEPFPVDAYGFKARVTRRDGSQVALDPDEDIQTKVLVRTTDKTIRQRTLILPGVTSDCVVELRWRERNARKQALPERYQRSAVWHYGYTYPVRKLTLHVRNNFPGKARLMPPRDRPVQSKTGDMNYSQWLEDLPAQPSEPFSIGSLQDVPVIQVNAYDQEMDWALPIGAERFWDQAADLIFRRYFEDSLAVYGSNVDFFYPKGETLPSDSFAAAAQVHARIEKRLPNLSAPTWEEQSLLPTPTPDPLEENMPVDRAIRHGVTDSSGMSMVLLRALQEAKLKTRVAMVADRSSHDFDQDSRNIWQFKDFLIGVHDETRGTLWIDPDLRFARPGTIDPNYEGTTALELVRNGNSWEANFIRIPISPPSANVARYRYQIVVGREGELFEEQAELTGLEARSLRENLLGIPVESQAEILAERLQERWRNMVVFKAGVEGLMRSGKPLTLQVKGSLKASGRQEASYWVDPFPTLPAPIYVQSPLPATRRNQIVMPWLKLQDAEAEVVLPPNYRLAEHRPIEVKNSFGTVTWRVDPLPDPSVPKVKVTFRVELSRSSAPPEAYEELRTFLQWVNEAYERMLLVERVI